LQGCRTRDAFRCSSRSWAVFPRRRSPASWAWGKQPSASGSREPGGSSKSAMPQNAARWCAIQSPPQNTSASVLRLAGARGWLSLADGRRSLPGHSRDRRVPASPGGATAYEGMRGRINEDHGVRHTGVQARGYETGHGAYDPRFALRSWSRCCWSIVGKGTVRDDDGRRVPGGDSPV